MKTLKLILVASMLLAAPLAGRAETPQAQLETYYRHPTPDAVPALVFSLNREGYFNRDQNVATSIGFLATVFAHNPDRVPAWLNDFRALPPRTQRLLAAALWQSGHPLGAEKLRTLGRNSPLAEEIERLVDTPSTSVAQTPVQSTSSMNLQWGAFLASGDERYVLNILNAIGTNQPGVDRAARLALAERAAQHPRVMQICQAQLARTPNQAPSELRAALLEATGKPQPRS